MKTKHIFSEELFKTAVALHNFEGVYTDLFDDWAASVPTMEPEAFWKHANRLRVIYNKGGRKSEKAAKEFLRQAGCEGLKQFSEAVRFSLSYWRYVETLKKVCENIQTGWGRRRQGTEEDREYEVDIEDEDYEGNIEELLDSLPMAGEDVCLRFVGGEYFKSPEEIDIAALEDDVRRAAPSSAEKILKGFNPLSEELHEEAAKYFRLFCLKYYDQLSPEKPLGKG